MLPTDANTDLPTHARPSEDSRSVAARGGAEYHAGMKQAVRKWLGLGAFLGASFAAGAIGSIFTASAVGTWYATLARPSFTPPSWIFGPVWSFLYAIMGLAAWLVWERAGFRAARGALGLFFLQLVLNAAWSALFFGLRRPDLAFAEIVLLWLAVLATAAAFFRARAPAGWFLLPYILWVSFAAVLNAAFWRLNP